MPSLVIVMSRLAKKPIVIPEKVEVTATNGEVVVKGPLGTIARVFRPEIAIVIEEKEIKLEPKGKSNFISALWGTYASHLGNMIEGVTKGFEKKLVIEGVGYKYNVAGDKVNMDIGLSHPILVSIPDGLKVITEKSQMTVSGIDKDLVGEFASKIRSKKPVEPYKGKGIRYVDEVVLRKQGKKTAA